MAKASQPATKHDIDGVIGIVKSEVGEVVDLVRDFMRMSDERFTGIEYSLEQLQADTRGIYDHLDSIEKRLEISEQERLVMTHQLTRLHEWVHRAAKKIDVEFVE